MRGRDAYAIDSLRLVLSSFVMGATTSTVASSTTLSAASLPSVEVEARKVASSSTAAAPPTVASTSFSCSACSVSSLGMLLYDCWGESTVRRVESVVAGTGGMSLEMATRASDMAERVRSTRSLTSLVVRPVVGMGGRTGVG